MITSTRYVKTKVYKRTIGKACIVRGCSKSATVTTQNKKGDTVMPVALCREHAAERGLVDQT